MTTLTDKFQPHIGVKEYEGIVATIQKWYYGSLVKDSWCATSMSYFANELGILDQLNGKNENVYDMMMACKKSGKGTFYSKDNLPSTIKRGTILFLLHSGTTMTQTSSKHVTTAYADFTYNTSKTAQMLGGNQSDQIKISSYSQSKIYAAFLPDYPDGHQEISKGDKSADVYELQCDLNTLGYTDADGNKLDTDSSFGRRTKEALIKFQKVNGLTADGVCTSATWAKLEEVLENPPKIKTMTATTDVYCRENPSKYSSALSVIKEGTKIKTIAYSDVWCYCDALGGWVSGNYLK